MQICKRLLYTRLSMKNYFMCFHAPKDPGYNSRRNYTLRLKYCHTADMHNADCSGSSYALALMSMHLIGDHCCFHVTRCANQIIYFPPLRYLIQHTWPISDRCRGLDRDIPSGLVSLNCKTVNQVLFDRAPYPISVLLWGGMTIWAVCIAVKPDLNHIAVGCHPSDIKTLLLKTKIIFHALSEMCWLAKKR